jgi:hypothetical protein
VSSSNYSVNLRVSAFFVAFRRGNVEFVSERLNTAYGVLKDKFEFGYSGEGQPLDKGLPTTEYLLIKPYYSPTGEPHTIVLTPSMSIIQYLYETVSNTWKPLKYSVAGDMDELIKKLTKQVNPPVWRE